MFTLLLPVLLALFYIKSVDCALLLTGGEVLCSYDSHAGDKCVAKLLDLRPTQFTIGQMEVDCKKAWLETLTDTELDLYIRSHPVPIWIGPDGLYMTDHHHLVRSVYEADRGKTLKQKYLFAEVQGNLADLQFRANFLQSMVSKGLIWLYDEQGSAPLNPEFLPDTVQVLANDPHRSLAWMAIVFGGFQKSDIRYAQFQWAEYFRKAQIFPIAHNEVQGAHPATKWSWCQAHPYSPLDCYLDQDFDIFYRALPIAMAMSNSTDASYLPGFGPSKLKEPKCGWNFFDKSIKNNDDAKHYINQLLLVADTTKGQMMPTSVNNVAEEI